MLDGAQQLPSSSTFIPDGRHASELAVGLEAPYASAISVLMLEAAKLRLLSAEAGAARRRRRRIGAEADAATADAAMADAATADADAEPVTADAAVTVAVAVAEAATAAACLALLIFERLLRGIVDASAGPGAQRLQCRRHVHGQTVFGGFLLA